ncbi:MAG: hypothetical protein ACFB0B_05140 [Thermonemataceae bacterium]
MSAVINKVLWRTLVITFYRANVGFFSLVIFLLFGFIRGTEHVYLASFLVSKITTTLFVYIVWVVYTLKTILFVLKQLQTPVYHFIFQIRLLSIKQRLLLWASIQLGLLLPILLYGVFLGTVAMSMVQMGIIPVLLFYLLTLLVVAIGCYEYRIRQAPFVSYQLINIDGFHQKWVKPYWSYFILYLLGSDLKLLLLSKLTTCGVISVFLHFYDSTVLDERYLAMAVLFTSTGNVVLMHQLFLFKQIQLVCFKNLPLPIRRDISHCLLTILLLCLPELMILAYQLWLTTFYVFTMLLGVAWAWFLYTLSYLQLTQEQLIVRIFFLLTVSVFLILGNLPVWLMALIFTVVGIYLYSKNYYKSENIL